MNSSETIGMLLRAHGLRSTPQRRAILAAFLGESSEHLSAEEVHSRASRGHPSLGRGTVYATLGELADRGLLSAVGLPEPVRYETNTEPHEHFRCRLCARLFDVEVGSLAKPPVMSARFVVEQVHLLAEGICADCVDYEEGLVLGVRSIQGMADGLPWRDSLERAGVGCAAIDGPLGLILLAASPDGLLRLAFEEHADARALRARAESRRGARSAREHLKVAAEEILRFLSGESHEIDCAIDLSAVLPASESLLSTRSIPYGSHSSYTTLPHTLTPRELGLWMGANPTPLVFPCHRVTRGKQVPHTFVAGIERRRWLEIHERQHHTSLEDRIPLAR